MNCETCKERQPQAEPVPYIVHEGEMARQERDKKRWFIAWLITFILFIASWAGFLWYESQWEVVETYQEVEQEANGNGTNNFIGGNFYGTADGQDEDAEPEA